MATGKLEGRVVARENKQPLAGAKVTLTRSVTKETYTGETGAKGEFHLTACRRATTWSKSKPKAGRRRGLNILQTVEGGKTTVIKRPFELEAERAYSVIRGAVFNEHGLTMSQRDGPSPSGCRRRRPVSSRARLEPPPPTEPASLPSGFPGGEAAVPYHGDSQRLSPPDQGTGCAEAGSAQHGFSA
jgi:hypothetical protein